MKNISEINYANKAMLLLIVPYGRAEDIAYYALEKGANCVTVFAAHGTVPKRILRMLGLDEIRRELIMITLESLTEASALMKNIGLSNHFAEKELGIAFIQPLIDLDKNNRENDDKPEEPVAPANYRSLIVIVDSGEGNTVVDIARQNKADGATIVDALGSADHSAHVFDFDINPRKDLVLLVSKKERAEYVQRALLNALRTTTPGRGISFMLHVTETLGIKGLESGNLLTDAWTHPAPGPYTALFVLVNRPKTKELIQRCEAAGNMGATIIHGRGIRHSDRPGSLFKESFDIERNMVLMVIKKEQEDAIIQVLKKLNVEDPDCALSISATDALDFSRFSYKE